MPENHRESQRGTLTLLAAFLFIIFSALGLGMLTVSQVYLKISGYRINALLLDFASENGIKHGFHELIQDLASIPNPSILADVEMDTLWLDTLAGGTQLIDKLKEATSTMTTMTYDKMSWESRKKWRLDRLKSRERYFKALLRIDILSQGKLEKFRPTKTTYLESELSVGAGSLPLAHFPFLLDQHLGSQALADFSQENPVEIILPSSNTILPQIQTTEEPILPRTASPFLEKALNVGLFQPGSLTAAQWRDVLGLELSNDPVPDGVYLIQDDSGLGGLFVQGDCSRLILAIEGENQVIFFEQEELEWTLRFSPTQDKTEFLTPVGMLIFDGIPSGIILVNGAVRSLGGGIVDSSGFVQMMHSEEIPCLLDGVNLTLVCSDEIVLSSHLILEGVTWHEGIPYVKDSKAMLNIFAPGQDFIDGTERRGRIAVDVSAPLDLKIHASLTAAGQGFVIEDDNKTVHLLGSLQTSDYASGGSTLRLSWDERFLDQDELLVNTPRSARPVLSILYLRTSLWSDEPIAAENE